MNRCARASRVAAARVGVWVCLAAGVVVLPACSGSGPLVDADPFERLREAAELLDDRGERAVAHQLEHDVLLLLVGLFDFEHLEQLDDVLVLEPPVDLELALHVLLGVLDLAELQLVHDLDRDAPQRLRVHRLLHLALRALADQLTDQVRADELACLLVGLDDRRALARLRDGLLLDAARHGLGGGAHQSAGIAQASRRPA